MLEPAYQLFQAFRADLVAALLPSVGAFWILQVLPPSSSSSCQRGALARRTRCGRGTCTRRVRRSAGVRRCARTGRGRWGVPKGASSPAAASSSATPPGPSPSPSLPLAPPVLTIRLKAFPGAGESPRVLVRAGQRITGIPLLRGSLQRPVRLPGLGGHRRQLALLRSAPGPGPPAQRNI